MQNNVFGILRVGYKGHIVTLKVGGIHALPTK
ncbi:hypothetical protein J2X57_001897 [Luteibacter sp. 1214]|nr:hypothetical protein [Luteibacter sp. 1214]